MTKDFDWKKHLIDCLESTNYCSIATVDKTGVWVNPVYFAWDKDFNLYFISMPHVRHMQNITDSSKVAVAIYKTEQHGEVIGIQIEGQAEILQSEQDKKTAYSVYYTRVGSLDQNDSFKDDPNWLFVKITPKKIYYFDSAVFGEERQTVPEEHYTL